MQDIDYLVYIEDLLLQEEGEETMKKIMFADRYGLTVAVQDGRKPLTRRAIPQKEFERIDKFQLDYYDATFDKLEGKQLIETYYKTYPERLPYKIGEVVAIAQSYRTILKGKKWVPFNMVTCEGYNNKMFVRADLMPSHIKMIKYRVEQLQEISNEDCLREGIEVVESYAITPNGKETLNYYRFPIYCKSGRVLFFSGSTPREAFAALIDRISGKGTWKSNPWVLAYEFKLTK